MKKFCSECGHPLEISKKFCSDCGTLNPFFSISHEIPSARSSAIDTLRARKESIERELEEIEREQAETLRKEKLRIEMEELEKQRMARLEKEREIKERFEREGIEASLKKELQQVKDETEQYKEQTTELLKELRSVVYQIDQENRKLKEEVEQIARVHVAPPVVVTPTTEVEQEEQLESEIPVASEVEELLVQKELAEESSGNSWIMGVVILLLILAVALFTYFYHSYASDPVGPSSERTAHGQADIPTDAAPPAENTTEEIVSSETNEGLVDNSLVENSSDVKSAPTNTEVSKSAPKVVSRQKTEDVSPAILESKPKSGFSLTVAQVKTDLLGKKLAGCGIVLNNAAEIEDISSPVIVEDATASGYVRYKLNIKVIQGGDTYHVIPYLYYTPEGKFLRVDAANCE